MQQLQENITVLRKFNVGITHNPMKKTKAKQDRDRIVKIQQLIHTNKYIFSIIRNFAQGRRAMLTKITDLI